MKILTLDNGIYDLDYLPDEIDDIYFWTLEYYQNSKENTDYYPMMLRFLDTFTDVSMELDIGGHSFKMPKSWSILSADKFYGDAELISTTSPGFNERGFSAFSLNPSTSFMANYLPIKIKGIYPEIRWNIPRLRNGQLLSVPITEDENGPCIYITNQKNYKVAETLNIEFII